jgi:hypothetical protein
MKRKEAVTIGTGLKKILDRSGRSSYRLSQELGIGQSYLSRLFNNKFNRWFPNKYTPIRTLTNTATIET